MLLQPPKPKILVFPASICNPPCKPSVSRDTLVRMESLSIDMEDIPVDFPVSVKNDDIEEENDDDDDEEEEEEDDDDDDDDDDVKSIVITFTQQN